MSAFKPLSRRTLLRSAGGIAMALPMLEAMLPRRASADAMAPPRRFLSWSQPNGTVPPKWRPTAGTGELDFTLSPILSPLERHKADLVVLQNLSIINAYGHHYCSTLTGRAAVDDGYPVLRATGISLDQELAKRWAGKTAIPSLQLGVMIGSSDAQLTSAVSWAGAGTAMPAENNPYAVFARLFNGNDLAAAEATRLKLKRRRSVLDSVKAQRVSVSQRLGAADKHVVDGYYDSVRQIETELLALEQKQAEQCGPSALPVDPSVAGKTPFWMVNDNTAAVLGLHFQLIALAFQCDLTRVITLTVAGSGGSARTCEYVPGVTKQNDWHGWSHQVETGNEGPMVAIDTWYHAQLAKLIDGLKSRIQPSGNSLLRDTLVFVNNEYGPNGPVAYLPKLDGGLLNLSHQTNLMPFLLLGQAGGALRTGRNIICPWNTAEGAYEQRGIGFSHTQLLVSILNAMGESGTTFGDPTRRQGALPGLLD